jgi:HK97 gp10 family phage protein
MPFAVKEHFSVTGLRDLMDRLAKFPVAMRTACRRAARKVGGQIARLARAKAPNRKQTVRVGNKLVRMYGASQTLKKSIGVKVTTTRMGIVAAIVGPKRGSSSEVFINYYKPHKSHRAMRDVMVKANPVKYAHLVELGFNAKIWGTNKQIRVSAKPFLRPALDGNKNQVAAITTSYFQIAIDDLISKGKITPDAGDV